jgi:hypothetical protein
MSNGNDTPENPEPQLESIPGRARIVDAEGNPIDPHGIVEPAPQLPPPEDPPPEDPPPEEPEPEEEHEESHRARSVRGRHSRSTK